MSTSRLGSAPHCIEALLFDLGGVVIKIDFDRAFRVWAHFSALSSQEIRARFRMEGGYEQHERGEIDASAYFEHLRNTLSLNGSDEQIAAGWNAVFAGEIAQTVDYVLAAGSALPCFAFTNSNPTHQRVWKASYPRVVAAFQRIFVSPELGLRKPEKAAFDAIADTTCISSRAMLFFDDTMENVQGARTAGLQAVHVRGPSDVKRALVEIGVL